MEVPGKGLAQGLRTTLARLGHPAVTQQYPDVQPALPPRSRGVIALLEENCTVCMLCARECPDWCIYIDSHKEEVPPKEPGARARQRNVLDRFAIDFSLCMYCGICVEVCPFDALFWSPEFEYADTDILGLTHEKDRLREWMWTVPPPAPLDEAAEPAKEIEQARKSAERAEAGAAASAGGATESRPRPTRADRPGRPAAGPAGVPPAGGPAAGPAGVPPAAGPAAPPGGESGSRRRTGPGGGTEPLRGQRPEAGPGPSPAEPE